MSNLETKQAGLNFNTKTFKKYINTCLGDNPVKIKGAHVALASAIENTLILFFNRLYKYSNKDLSGLKTVTSDIIKKTLKHFDNTDFGEFFNQTVIYKYDKSNVYTKQFCISEKNCNVLLEQVYNDMKLTDKAKNLLFFMLQKLTNTLIKHARLFPVYAKKKTLDSKSIVSAIDIVFDGELAFKVKTAVEKSVTAVKNCNYKSTLNQYFRKEDLGEPVYKYIKEVENKDGTKSYTVNVLKGKEIIGNATFSSKGRTEQRAAKDALIKLGVLTKNEEDASDEEEKDDSGSDEDSESEEEDNKKVASKTTKKISDDEESEDDSDEEDSDEESEDEQPKKVAETKKAAKVNTKKTPVKKQTKKKTQQKKKVLK
jgi:hypothetical protein